MNFLFELYTEINCFQLFSAVSCTLNEFKCGGGNTAMCIQKSKECDRRRDCPNGEDEHPNCSKFQILRNKMAQKGPVSTICSGWVQAI